MPRSLVPLRTVAPSPYPPVMASKIGVAALVGLVALTVTACGDDGKAEAKSDPSPKVIESTSSEPASESISDDCKLAVLNWQTIANKQRSDLAFGAPDNAGDPARDEHSNEIRTYCPQEIGTKVAEINYRLSVGEAQVTAGKEPDEDIATLTNDIASVGDAVK